MAATIRTRIIRIGNSQGIRIPRTIIEQLHLTSDVELEVEDDRLIVRPASRRQGWEAAFEQMAARGDDHILKDMPDSLTRWDEEEWAW